MTDALIYVTNDVRPAHLAQDGDVVVALSPRRIKCCHAEMICHPRKAGFNGDGLRPAGGVSQEWFERTHQFRFERISRNEVRRTNLWTLEEVVLSQQPNGAGEYIHVTEYLIRRKAHPRHRIFGTDGAEVWYGGRKTYTDAGLTAVWNKIETDTPLREVDHRNWPFSDIERRRFLPVKLDLTNHEIAQRLNSHELDYDGWQPQYALKGESKIVRKHRGQCDWRSLGLKARDVLDRSVELDAREALGQVDARAKISFKPRVNIWIERTHVRAITDTDRKL